VDCSRLVPLSADGQQSGWFFYHKDILVLMQDGQPFWLPFIFAQMLQLISCVVSVHLETPEEETHVSDLETSNFSQGQGNQTFERKRSTLRRTNKWAD
jgi:hypothetical protein